ncbi:MAG: hypothetical protein FWG90_11420 [Oscillospiraceae bacterium]|nr:hypothetical protein [Oscillospiraceae bacterium]
MFNHIYDYYKSVCEAYNLGNVESSYTTAIMLLLEQFGCKARDCSGERGGSAGENIDIKLWREDEIASETEPFAAVEVKKIGGIDARAKEQIIIEAKRYGNVILTDNLSWRFWNSGEEKMYAGLTLIENKDGILILKENNIELFISLVQDFMLKDPSQIRSSDKLAEYMAIHAKTIRSVVTGILKDDGLGQPLVSEEQKRLPMFTELFGLYSKIKEELRPNLTSSDFADIYAQTIVYGLFIAKHNNTAANGFDRYTAVKYLQNESILLNRFFQHITGTGGRHPTLESVIEKLCRLYKICDISSLLDSDESRDTIVHFYEDFLTYYDPELRKELGVFYTPIQAVRYLVTMVDKLLVEEFGISGGLSNNERMQYVVPCKPYTKKKGGREYTEKEITIPRVAILDPACGTGTFHAEIIKYIKSKYFSAGREAFYKDYIQSENGLLSRIIGFEIMMTSYVVAHLKIRRAVKETLGAAPEVQLPTKVYLTNTLAPSNTELEQNNQITFFDFSAAMSDEAYQADTWKTRRPIKVIIGNPPYFSKSKNFFDISAYKTETDGITEFKERKHWLNDDYVQFFRFAQEIIERDGEGVLAYVSNNGFLDNPTFRGMRASLLRSFDRIYIVNLHGNARKREATPDGGKDENIFDIMQGVSLFIGIKTTNCQEWAKVYYADLWGTREQKFNCLDKVSFDYSELSLDKRMAYFIPFGDTSQKTYCDGVSVAELFPVNVTGIVSGNDEASIAPTRDILNYRMEIVKNAIGEKPIVELWGRFGRGQSAEKIKTDVIMSDGVVAPIAYRPFDNRWTYYSGNSCGWIFWPREKKTMGHLLQKPTTPIGQNIGLVFPKGTNRDWDGAFVSNTILDAHCIDYPGRSIAYIAPLYTYSELGDEWSANFNYEALERLTENMSFKPTPIEIFDYIYGVLYDPAYRERFDEFLKRDYPRVPIINAPKNDESGFYVSEERFREYVKAGEHLRKLHLMQIKTPATLTIEPNNSDNLLIDKISYKGGVLNINKNKQISGILEDVWAYRIGGYQVLDKWFKSHKGETLTLERFEHICNVVGLLGETIRIQERLRRVNT